MSVRYNEVLEEIKSMSDEQLETNLARILQGWPNTYTFSKALCEEMVSSEKGDLPVAVFRPSCVVTSYMEPVRGYTDNTYGPMGNMVGVNLGLIHCLHARQDLSLDMVPVDYVVNCMIAVAYRTAQSRADSDSLQSLPVYNFTSFPHNMNGMSCKHMVAVVERIKHHWPFQQAVWTNSFFSTESAFLDSVAHTLLHKFPGIILDRIAVMYGRKPILTKIYDRLLTMKRAIRLFTFRVWEFETTNISKLRKILNEDDQKLFNFDLRDVNVIETLCICKLGLRYYYLKEKMDTLPAAELKFKRLFWLHRSLKFISGFFMLKIFVIIARALPI